MNSLKMVFVSTSILLLAACGSDTPSSNKSNQAGGNAALDGKYQLVTIACKDGSTPALTPTLDFTKSVLQLTAGKMTMTLPSTDNNGVACNYVTTGDYTVTGTAVNTIHGQITGCGIAPTAQADDNETYTITGNQLVLSDAAGNTCGHAVTITTFNKI